MKQWILPIAKHETTVFIVDDDQIVHFDIAPEGEMEGLYNPTQYLGR